MGILQKFNRSIYNVSGPQTGPSLVPTETSKEAKPPLASSYNKTSLDLENPLPLGGPINVPYNTPVGTGVISSPTTQPYTPRRTYVDSLQDPLLIARSTDPIK
jgi:hypothetical protein